MLNSLQTRSVNCIQEVRHGSGNVLRVDEAFCPQPPPITQQFCNVVDCSPKWSVTPWEKVRPTDKRKHLVDQDFSSARLYTGFIL